jgi:hypothetical protein
VAGFDRVGHNENKKKCILLKKQKCSKKWRGQETTTLLSIL